MKIELDAAFAVCVTLVMEALLDVVGLKTLELTEPLLMFELVVETPAGTVMIADGVEVELERLRVTLTLAQNF